MAEEIPLENGQITHFEEFMTLTLERVILHIVVHHSLTSTYMPKFTEIKETFCGQMDVWRDRFMNRHLRPALLGRLCRRVDLKRANAMKINRNKTSVMVNANWVQFSRLPNYWQQILNKIYYLTALTGIYSIMEARRIITTYVTAWTFAWFWWWRLPLRCHQSASVSDQLSTVQQTPLMTHHCNRHGVN